MDQTFGSRTESEPDGPISLPGRLGDPTMSLASDPRADPRMLAAMRPFGLDQLRPVPPLGLDGSIADILDWTLEAETSYQTPFAAIEEGNDAVEGVSVETTSIQGDAGHDITLYIHRPTHGAGRLPGLVHIHGGGGTILSAADANFVHLRNELASTGMVVIGVEFRNAGGKLGAHPFPAGLDDCAAAVRWAQGHSADLGISAVVVSGESGGGNLSLGLTHRAKREGWLREIDGVYALCPSTSGLWALRPPDLPSMRENDGYFVTCHSVALLARVYDPTGSHSSDPECWPLTTSIAGLEGMPPHVISVNELDILRDEGLAYYRRLAAAGVSVVGRTVNGTCHSGDLVFGKALPDIHAATLRDIKGFADSLGH